MTAPPGWQGPGWYYCEEVASGLPPSDFDPNIPPCVPGEEGNVPPEGFSSCVSASASLVQALESVVRARAGEGLSLSTSRKPGSTRFVSPAQTSASTTRKFGATATSQPTVRLATVPGAMCDVSAKAGRTSVKLVSKAQAANGQLDTRVNATTLRSRLKAAPGSQAVITAACAVKAGKKMRKIPPATVTVAFS